MAFVGVGTFEEIPLGEMKHIEVGEKEIMIANVEGTFYAISDRCGHANARLSGGVLDGTIVTCPLHGARFDVTTGKKISDPKGFRSMLQKRMMGLIKTYDVETFEVRIEGKDILVKIE